MEVIKLLVSKKKNIEKLSQLTNDLAFISSLLKWKGYKECPSGISIKIGIVRRPDDEKEIGNTCGNCGKPNTTTELD